MANKGCDYYQKTENKKKSVLYVSNWRETSAPSIGSLRERVFARRKVKKVIAKSKTEQNRLLKNKIVF